MNEKALGTQRISLLALKYILPSILGMMFMSLQSIIDGFFVGKFAGEIALGALNIVMPVLNVSMALAMIVVVGGQSLMSIYLGGNNRQKAHHVFRSATVGIIILGVAFSLVGIFFAEQISLFLGASTDFLPHSTVYLRTMACFGLPFMLWFLCDYALRVMGKVNRCMVAMIVGAVLNALLDFLFLFVFKMGMFGAALATGLSVTTSFIICAIPLLNKNNTINFFSGRFKTKLLFKMSFNGISEGINSIASAIVIMLINNRLMTMVGNNGVIAYTGILYVTQIGFGILSGVSDGVRPLISYNFGAQHELRLKKIMALNVTLAMIVGVLLFILLFFFGRPLVGIFITETTALEMGVRGAKLFAFAFLFSGINIFMSCYFTAIDLAIESGAVALMRGLVFIVIGIFTLPIPLGLDGVWLSMPFSELMTLLISGTLFLFYLKKKIVWRGKKKKQLDKKTPIVP